MDEKEELSPKELEAVEAHRRRLSEARAAIVSRDEAKRDWLEHHAAEWRCEELRRYLSEQREEILRHKWIESEKAKRDLGNQAALDWISKHAASWREQYEREHGVCLQRIS